MARESRLTLFANEDVSCGNRKRGPALVGVMTGCEVTQETRVPPGSSQNRAAFDAWLRRELSRSYDAALRETVPDELLRLIDAAAEGT